MKNPIRRCLIIDDDPDDQEVFSMCVKKIDSDIICLFANSSAEAVSLLTKETASPDCIFLDVNMPKVNGMECLKQLRTIQHLHTCKIFLYSTTSDETLIKQSNELGANGYIVKPSKTVELIEKLIEIFKPMN